MDTRHFYKHKVTGIVSPLNDSFAAVFGDRFKRVGAPTGNTKTVENTVVTDDETPTIEVPADDQQAVSDAKPDTTTADAPKEGDK